MFLPFISFSIIITFFLPILTLEEIKLPSSFNLREKYSKCESLFDILDQSNCDGCWAYASASAMSDRLCIHSKNQTDQRRVSPTYLLSCCENCGYGCDGGWLTDAYDFWKENGIPTGGQYNDYSTCQPNFLPKCNHVYGVSSKYDVCESKNAIAPTCQNKCFKKNLNFNKEMTYGSTGYYYLNGEEEIMKELYINGSVTCVMYVYSDFLYYKNGVYKHKSGGALGGHAIKIIGWGIENGEKYWLCANSWNEQWGENGLFKILRGVNECGVEKEATAAMPKIQDLREISENTNISENPENSEIITSLGDFYEKSIFLILFLLYIL